MTAYCWPEQEAVWEWMEKHNIQLTRDQEEELKSVVTAYRLTRDERIADLEEQLALANPVITRDADLICGSCYWMFSTEDVSESGQCPNCGKIELRKM